MSNFMDDINKQAKEFGGGNSSDKFEFSGDHKC